MHALIDHQSLLITEGDRTIYIAGTDPAYPKVVQYLIDSKGKDFDAVAEMISTLRSTVTSVVADALAVVDGDQDEEPYRIKNGDPVEEVVLSAAIRLGLDAADTAPLGAFLRRLEANPFAASRSQLFGWLKANGFTITTDGMIVGYKGVTGDGRSVHSGVETVTITHQNGIIETVSGQIPYPVGAIVSMNRDQVTANRHVACSVGIHVGTLSYAGGYGTQMLVVLVDPADVVAVPADAHGEKMRVCRLTVAAKYDRDQGPITGAVVSAIATVPDFVAIREYAERPENQPLAIEDEDGEDEDYDDSDGYYGDTDYYERPSDAPSHSDCADESRW